MWDEHFVAADPEWRSGMIIDAYADRAEPRLRPPAAKPGGSRLPQGCRGSRPVEPERPHACRGSPGGCAGVRDRSHASCRRIIARAVGVACVDAVLDDDLRVGSARGRPLTRRFCALPCGDMTVVLFAVAAVVSLGLVAMCQGCRRR